MYEKDSLIKLINNKEVLKDFLINKNKSIHWQTYLDFQFLINTEYINEDVKNIFYSKINLDDKFNKKLKDELLINLLLDNNHLKIIKPNTDLIVSRDEIFAFICLYFMLIISTKFNLEVYSQLKSISIDKIKLILKQNRNKVIFDDNNLNISSELKEGVSLAEEISHLKKSNRNYSFVKKRLLIEGFKTIFEGSYRLTCIKLAYFYNDKEYSYFQSMTVGKLFDQYINKNNIPEVFNNFKNKNFIQIANATRHHTPYQSQIDIDLKKGIYIFKDTNKPLLKLSVLKLSELMHLIAEYDVAINTSISLLNLLSLCEDFSIKDFDNIIEKGLLTF